MTSKFLSRRLAFASLVCATFAVLASVLGCSSKEGAKSDVSLVIGCYSAPREVLDRRIIPAFAEAFRKKTGKTVSVEASYLASGAQTRAVLGGFEADVVVLALESDVEKLAAAKLVSADWKNPAKHPFVTSTLVAFAVRTGNPKNIRSWPDLARPGVEVLMPNPKTSGGAMWNVNAIYGAALRGKAGVPAGDKAAAEQYLRSVLGNVLILDKGARESMITFEKGVGDVAITYESEILAGRIAGRKYDEVIPDSTLLIEIPAAVVDAYADRHGTRSAAEEFVAFLHSAEAERAFAEFGFRSVEHPSDRPMPADLWRVDFLGGWSTVSKEIYGPGGVFPKVLEVVNGK